MLEWFFTLINYILDFFRFKDPLAFHYLYATKGGKYLDDKQ